MRLMVWSLYNSSPLGLDNLAKSIGSLKAQLKVGYHRRFSLIRYSFALPQKDLNLTILILGSNLATYNIYFIRIDFNIKLLLKYPSLIIIKGKRTLV